VRKPFRLVRGSKSLALKASTLAAGRRFSFPSSSSPLLYFFTGMFEALGNEREQIILMLADKVS